MTTTRITHATPAGTYAHVANRDWEDDYAQSFDGVDSTICDDIAEQLVLSSPGKNFKVMRLFLIHWNEADFHRLLCVICVRKVILGGGRAYFTPRTMTDVETGAAGRRRDGQDLIGQW